MGTYYKYKGNIDITSEEGTNLLNRDINCIANSEMWFSKLESLNDKNEGIHSLKKLILNLEQGTKFLDLIHLKKFDEAVNSNYIGAIKKVINLHLKNSGIFSLTTDGFNNLMWSHYANSHQGYCVEYEFNGLEDLKLRHADGHHLKHFDRFEKVTYGNKVFSFSNINFHYDDFTKIITQKTKEWLYEKEFRVIVDFAGSYKHNPSITKSVIFGLATTQDVKEHIIGMLKNKDLKFYRLKRERYDSLHLVRERVIV